jgi:triacylglycerol lipase
MCRGTRRIFRDFFIKETIFANGPIGLEKIMVFVLVHGINDTCLKFKKMKSAFENKGYRCIVPSLTPKNASKGLEYLASQLKDTITDELDSKNTKVCLVGFSMGGLISRYYLQELEGYKVVSQFFSISAPHHGSILAYLSSNLGARQMRPGSDFILSLEQSSERLQGLDCYSYWTSSDLMILPATSSIWEKAENIKVNSLCHPFMLKNDMVIEDILEKVRRLRNEPQYSRTA